jgi:predicted dehydrogenase/predicted NBD/HSP70 family sugar kinase
LPKGTHHAAVKLARTEKLATVLANLRDAGPNSVSALAANTGLSRPTVTSILQELEQIGLVEGDDPLVFGGGRPATPYKFRATAGYALAVDLLQSSLAVALCALDGNVVSATAVRVPASATPEERLQFLVTSVDDFLDGAQIPRTAVLAATVSTTGTIDDAGTVQVSYWVPIWEGFPLGERLNDEWQFPVSVVNDVNSAAFAELALRPTLTARDLLYVRFNPRVTMGLVLGGRIHGGMAFRAGELPGEIGARLMAGEGSDRRALAEAIALAAAVVDPALVVLQSNRDDTDDLVERVRSDLDSLIPPSGDPVVIEAGKLGQSAAIVGGLSLALAGAMSRILEGIAVEPPMLQGIDRLRRVLRAGGHTATWAAEDDQAETPALRVGVVGTARAADLGIWVEQPANNAMVVGAYDPGPEAGGDAADLGRDIAERHSVGELVATGVDAVIFAGGQASTDDVCAVLRADIPAFIEQPFAPTIEDAAAIVAAAGRSTALLVVGNRLREGAAIRAFREVIRGGGIGDLSSLWCRHLTPDGLDAAGQRFLSSVADVDAIQWLADSTAEGVVAIAGGDRDGVGRCAGIVLIRLASGVAVSYEASPHTGTEWREYVAIGSRGRAELSGDGSLSTVTVWSDDGTGSEPVHRAVFDSESPGVLRPEERMVSGFLRRVRGGPGSDGFADGWRAFAAAAEAESSARKGTIPSLVLPS